MPGVTTARSRFAALSLVLAFGASLAVGLFSINQAHPFTVGDEPHYVVIANSILRDGDIDLANNYGEVKSREVVFPKLPVHIHAFHYRKGGPLAPIHGTGLPLLLVPFLAFHQTMYTARIAMVVLSALLGATIFSMLRAIAGRASPAVVVAWAAVALTMPMMVFSFEVYPDLPGALFVALALRALVSPVFGRRHAIALGACAAYLPWLHVRFGILALPLVIGGLVRLRQTGRSLRPLLVSFGIGVALLGLLFLYLYGSPSPSAPYNVEPFITDNTFAWMKAYRWGLGTFMGLTVGLIPWAPVLWFGVVGLGWFRRTWSWSALAGVGATAALYLLLVGGHGPVINVFPGRSVLVFVPVLAVGVLGALQASRVMALGVVATSLLCAAIGVQSVRHLFLLFDVGEVRIASEKRIVSAFPYFTEPPGGLNLAIELDKQEHDTGRIVPGEQGRAAVEAGPGDAPGTLFKTVPLGFQAGMYELSLVMQAPSGAPPVPLLKVTAERSWDKMPYAQWTLWSPDVAAGPVTRLRYMVPDLNQMDVVVSYTGTGTVRITDATITPAGSGVIPQRTAHSDLPLTVLWIAMSGVVLVLLARLSPSPSRSSAGL